MENVWIVTYKFQMIKIKPEWYVEKKKLKKNYSKECFKIKINAKC